MDLLRGRGWTTSSQASIHSEVAKHYDTCGSLGEGTSGAGVIVVQPRGGSFVNQTASSTSRRARARAFLACKVYDYEGKSAQEAQKLRKKAQNEKTMLQRLANPGLVEVHDVIDTPSGCAIIMPLLSGGGLTAELAARGSFAEEDAKAIVTTVLQCLGHLHAQGVAHRDLKLDNILLASKDDPSKVKIVDLGMAKEVQPVLKSAFRHKVKRTHSICGTPLFVAPEVVTGADMSVKASKAEYDTSCDLWSCGVILYMLLSGSPPFILDGGLRQLFKDIKGSHYSFDDPIWQITSPLAMDLVQKMMEVDPEKRITATEALDHPWLA